MNESPHPLIDIEWIRHACCSPTMPVRECLLQLDRVGPNALFDVAYYRENYGRDIPHGMSCLEHFCRQERFAPRNPNRLFSTKQWHETIGWRFTEGDTWRRELFTSMGAEARFSRHELQRQESGAVIFGDQQVSPPPRPGQEICLFVHYDRHDDVQDYVIDYLDALCEQDVSIVFLTNSVGLCPEAAEKLKNRVWRVVYTDNKAYDWGLYSIGVRLINDLGISGHPIVLANDSVIGTMDSLSPLFEVARSGRYEVTGAIDSLLHDWHLQSFFIYCSAEMVASEVWRSFWQLYRPHSDRWYVVNAQEMGFSRWLVRHNIPVGAAWSYEELLRTAENGKASEWRAQIIAEQQITNPTIEMWDLLLKVRFPFLKKAVLTTPLSAGNITELCNVLSMRNGVMRQA